MNDRDKESRRASINLGLRRKQRQEQRARTWVARVFFIMGIVLTLIGVFGEMVIEESITTESEYHAWEGSFWDVALDGCLVTGIVAFGLAVLIAFVFIRG